VSAPAPQQISDWLAKLGMSEYAQGFAENDIDFTILGDLTDQDLEKIGVASLGRRRKLLRAIATLHAGRAAAPRGTACGRCSRQVAWRAPESAATTSPLPSTAANVAGERRYLMFCHARIPGSACPVFAICA